MQTEQILLTIAGTIVGILGTVITIYKTNKKDVQTEQRERTSTEESLKYIARMTEDIKYDTKSLRADLINTNERLIRTEESVKLAHIRIDEFNKKRGN